MSALRRIPPRVEIPAPPDPLPDPLLHVWPAGHDLARCHASGSSSTAFLPGRVAAPSRFSPFSATSTGVLVPVLYAADDDDGALSETVFHDVPVRGPGKQVARTALRDRVLSAVAPLRDLCLADLRAEGLARLEVTRFELIESDTRSYVEPARYSRAVHAHPARFDGLIWVSRQRDLSQAVLLFGDRVAAASSAESDDLLPSDARPSLPLILGRGREMVDRIAARAGIRITES